ncbi:MAG TPA: TIGR03118 family protein [Pyrinomonadaceae bacterium]|nr:TIGR03118 family protein [Pyrinomonadaceae bacterium]
MFGAISFFVFGLKTNSLHSQPKSGQFPQAAGWVLCLALILCASTRTFAQHYNQTNLVSDLPGVAPVTDPNLVNPWGLAASSTSPWWVADNGTGVSTLYNGNTGAKQALTVTIPTPVGGTPPSAPTGVVFNGNSGDFGGARFIFVTEEGTISAWTSGTSAVLKYTSPTKAIYKGATIAEVNGARFLYVANFYNGTVDVFNTSFAPTFVPVGAFTDPNIPAGFAPFNVQELNGNLFVAFAKQDEDKEDEVAGAGLGFADIFDPNGNLVLRLRSGHWMNAPWGVALAPDSGFGKLNSRLLVGQFGSGEIATFDLDHGNFHGMLNGSTGQPLAIEGLWALRFGNGAAAGPKTTLFFTAGIDDEEHGLFGAITPWSRGVDHDVTTSLLAPDNDGAGSTVSVESNNQNSTRVPLNVVTPIVLLPTDEEEQPAPKKRKAKEAREPREP